MSIYSYGLSGDAARTIPAYVMSILTKSCRLLVAAVVAVVAGSIKTRHQFICPELSLAHLIHLVAVRRGEQDWQTKQIKGRTGLGHFDLASGAYERLVLIEGDTRNPLANGNGLQKLR